MTNQGRAGYALTLAQQMFGMAPASSEQDPTEPATDLVEAEGNPAPASEVAFGSPPVSQQASGDAEKKQIKTAEELAEMIETDLTRHPDCPKAGFRVTVYGWPYWQAMLTIEPAAGRVRNPREWRDLTSELAERLRKRYDLA